MDKDELGALAKLNGTRPWQQEKHYIQSLLLVSLSDQPLVFKGGTYLWFFHGLPRFSEDLDFTASGQIPDELDRKASDALKLFGIENTVKRVEGTDRSLSFRISAKGPLNTSDIDLCHVYVEISRRETVLKTPLPLKLDAYGLPSRTINGMDLEEVLAEKARAILKRDKPRDLFDAYFLIKRKGITPNLRFINEKMAYYGEKFDLASFEKRLGQKKAWSKEMGSMLFEKAPAFEDVVSAIREAFRGL